ncbi:uncharacterized protein LOC126625111 isoform X1 [Malus sylvestris]|uniref:uncharacterized protein LOC126625111 isoform X1 n=2 Tax=Malus sylvestris TaxID=3752 RepID=UPI0021AC9607|nr:uncharacterized protein LOC126625111 isoform X1 [Malus sylvestris]XP_050150143.1 uncharacterized protein LOC126625111 isoform X1 [Malus sylvestris]XP_050150144.1 uncharacterized protein LOC126625111 isoform X1 [Malus sylvestris]
MAQKGMNVDGQICTQRAVDKAGKEFATGLGYRRSSPLASLNYNYSFSDPPTWFLPSKVSSGHLDFIPEDGAIKVGRHQGDLFQAYTLMKVNNEADGDTKFKVDTNSFPLLHKMIREKTDWGLSVKVTGCATFQVGVLEWTETTLRTYENVLRQADIYGAVAVSRYPYKYSSNVWKAFCELWGPLTNTFHQGNGEMSISLYDLKVIGGLPILGAPYEEFIPPNDDLCKKEAYPSTLPELLRIHSHLCKFYGQKHIFWNQWLDHFYRGKIVYAGYGEKNQRMSPNEQKIFKARGILLEVTKEGALAAFLVFWLCRFVLPLKGGKVRPETFPMACLIAQGSKVSLAPTVLGYIYRGLGDIVSCPRGPGFTYISMPVHYIVGWLGEHFPYLYRSRPDSDFPKGYPQLARYAGVEPREVNISQARFIFRSDKSVIYRPTVFVEEKGCSLMDNEDLSDDYFEFLVCVRTAKLPVRIGEHLWLEPYFPNRFARQFGFDQGVPTNNLAFGVSSRQNCSVEAMFEAQTVLLKRNTGSLFYVPCSTHQGICTYWYCKWWRTSCVTYLGISLADIYAIFNKRPLNKKTVFSVSVLRDITPGLRKEILLFDAGIEKSPSLHPVGQSSGFSKNRNATADEKCKAILDFSSSGSSLGSNHDVNFKRARYENPDGPGGVDIETVTAADNFTPEIIPGNLSTPSVKVTNQPCRGKSAAYVSNEVAPSSLQEVTASIHALFGSEVSNFRQGYIIGEVENIFVKLSSCNSPTEILGCHEEVNLVLDVLVPIINILESGRTELEWFVKTVRRIFACASQISDNAKIIDQGNHIRDLLRRHDECLSTKKAFESELNKSIQELKKIEAEELPVKEAEEIARVLRQQYDSGKHAVKRRVSDLKASIERQKKLDVELRQFRADTNEGLLSDVERVEALNKSAEEGILNSIASLLHFCSKPE